jgi:MFS family permease
MFALMATCILNFFVIFKQSFLTIELEETFKIDEAYHGIIVSVPALFQIVGAYVVGMLIDKASKRTWIFIAFIFLSLSDFLMGPSRLLYFNGLSWLFFIGQAINGTGTGMIYTPMLPEIIESVYEKTEIVEGEDENLDAILADKASGLYFAFFSLGTITAPPMGSVVYSIVNKDWAYTCDVFGIAAAIFTVIYLVFNLLPDIKKERES